MANHTNQLSKEMQQWLQDHAARPSTALTRLMQETMLLDDAEMMTSPEQVQFLAFLAKSINTKNAIEVGVYTGACTLAIAEVLPEDGTIIACDVTLEYVPVCSPAWEEADVEQKIDLRIAPAIDTLQSLLDEGKHGAFDFMYIDADKIHAKQYYELGLQLIRDGGIIAIDNMFYGGQVAEDTPEHPNARAMKELTPFLQQDKRVDYSLIPIGDGLALLRRIESS